MASSNSNSELNSSDSSTSSESTETGARQIEPIRMPTMEEIQAQEVWNNCVIRSAFSGVVGETNSKQLCVNACARFLFFIFLLFVSTNGL